MTPASRSRETPCASCPYRLDVPSGVWHEEEYAKLEDYDGETFQQNPAAFQCHTDRRGTLCAGWVGHVESPWELLAIRFGTMRGEIDAATLDYTTTVPLFASGREAADHGRREIDRPGERARAVMEKVTRLRELGTTEGEQR